MSKKNTKQIGFIIVSHINGLSSITGNLSHLGISRVRRKSSLSYMNGHRDYELFKDFYFQLLSS